MGYSDGLDEILQQGYRYAFSLTHNEDDAYDLVQNTYLKLIEKNKPLVVSYLISLGLIPLCLHRRKRKV